jgi:hypothetical protein
MRKLLAILSLAITARAQGVPGLPACPEGPLYSVIPMALDDFMAFRPLGFMSLPSNAFPLKHSNFSIAMPGETTPERPVVFPGDLWVTEIWSYRSENYGGYQLYFQPCAQVRGYLFHLKDLAPRLKEALQAAQAQCEDYPDPAGVIVKCRAQVLVRVAAGEAAAVSGDGAGVDFGMADFRISPQGLAILEHYPYDYPYYVSPVDYYPPDLKAQFSTKLASWDGSVPRTAEPRVGTYRPDIAGTAQGNWFLPGKDMRASPADMTPNLVLAGDYVDPEQPIIMLGTSVPGAGLGLYSFTPAGAGDVNRAFRDVLPGGGVYCYENLRAGRSRGLMPLTSLDGVLLVTMPGSGSLSVEKQGGAGATCDALRPWSLTGNAATFER